MSIVETYIPFHVLAFVNPTWSSAVDLECDVVPELALQPSGKPRPVDRIIAGAVAIIAFRIGADEASDVWIIPPPVHVIQSEARKAQVAPAAAPAIVIPGRPRIHPVAPGIVKDGIVSPDAIGGDEVGGIAVPVILDVVGGIVVEGLQIVADGGGFNPRGASVGIPVAHEVEGVAAGGGVPGFAQEPVGVAIVGVGAVNRRKELCPLRERGESTGLVDVIYIRAMTVRIIRICGVFIPPLVLPAFLWRWN